MTVDRRQFVTTLLVSGAAAAVPANASEIVDSQKQTSSTPEREGWNSTVDFRYAPHHSQATICFPDDHYKSIVGLAGDLRYEFPKALLVGMEDFGLVIEFSLAGFQDDKILRQWIESPNVPIVHTVVDRPGATMEIVSFATRHGSEGRVDNVLLKIRSKSGTVAVTPKLRIRTCEKLALADYDSPVATAIYQENKVPLLVGAKIGESKGRCVWWEEAGFTLYLPHAETSPENEAQYFIRIPQEKQSAEMLRANLQQPEMLLAEVREFWSKWKPFGETGWSYPDRHGEFLTVCARNIQQAREEKNGRLVFQVGPTVYRGLWIVDGNFMLEAARYLGYDREADDGLRAEWAKQVDTGQG